MPVLKKKITARTVSTFFAFLSIIMMYENLCKLLNYTHTYAFIYICINACVCIYIFYNRKFRKFFLPTPLSYFIMRKTVGMIRYRPYFSENIPPKNTSQGKNSKSTEI